MLTNENKELKVLGVDKDDKYAKLVLEKEELEKLQARQVRDLENERKGRSKLQAEYTAFRDESQIGSGMDSKQAKALI